MKTDITCVRCCFAFRDELFKSVHVCPSCGAVMEMSPEESSEGHFRYSYIGEIRDGIFCPKKDSRGYHNV